MMGFKNQFKCKTESCSRLLALRDSYCGVCKHKKYFKLTSTKTAERIFKKNMNVVKAEEKAGAHKKGKYRFKRY